MTAADTFADAAAISAGHRTASSSARKRRYRARRAAGEVVLTLSVDEVKLVEVLTDARVFERDPPREYSREDLVRGLERLIDKLAGEEARVPSSPAVDV